MKRLALSAAVLGALFAAPAPAAPHHKHKHKHQSERPEQALTFSGGCAFSGNVQFRPPLTNSGQPARDFASARGTCSGTLTDGRGETRRLSAAPVAYRATDAGPDVSCGLSAGATGRGELVFTSSTLRFALSETRAGGTAELSLTGARGGSATGVANINTKANPVQIIEACGGPGLREAPVDINLRTTPAISG